MIISSKLIAAAVVLESVLSQCHGRHGPAAALAPLRVIQIHGDMAALLASLASAYGVTVGLELDTERYHQVFSASCWMQL
jgi:hypothetical protein